MDSHSRSRQSIKNSQNTCWLFIASHHFFVSVNPHHFLGFKSNKEHNKEKHIQTIKFNKTIKDRGMDKNNSDSLFNCIHRIYRNYSGNCVFFTGNCDFN